MFITSVGREEMYASDRTATKTWHSSKRPFRSLFVWAYFLLFDLLREEVGFTY